MQRKLARWKSRAAVFHSIDWADYTRTVPTSPELRESEKRCRTVSINHLLLTLGPGAGIHPAMSYSHLARRIFVRARRLSAGVWDMRIR
jgi:hypothetical protein